jgi:hypothetical protein
MNDLSPSEPPRRSDTDAKLLDEIDPAVDRVILRLRFFKLPQKRALHYLLTAFEGRIALEFLDRWNRFEAGDKLAYTNIDGVVASYTGAVTRLEKLIRKHCPPSGDAPLHVPYSQDLLNAGDEALRAGVAYDRAAHELESAYQGLKVLTLAGKRITTDFSVAHGREYEAQVGLAGYRLAADRPSVYSPVDILRFRQDVQQAIIAAIRPAGSRSIRYEIPELVRRYFQEQSEVAIGSTLLPSNTTVGGYSVGDFRVFYRALYARAAMNQAFCCFAEDKGLSIPSENLVLQVTTAELERDLVGRGALSTDAFTRILADLIFDPHLVGTSLHYQPLVEMEPGRFDVPPSLITSNRWDESLEQTWRLRHLKGYEDTVPAIKKGLSDDLAARFRELGFLATSDTELFVDGGKKEVEVDVAVADVARRVLALVEVKWFLMPATVFRAMNRNEWLRVESQLDLPGILPH